MKSGSTSVNEYFFSDELQQKYRAAAQKYKPDKIEVLIIAESPPPFRNKAARYFYFDELSEPENLYHGVMTAIYGNRFDASHQMKPNNLRQFCHDGFFLIDAVKFPFYEIQDASDKQNVIKSYASDRAREVKTLGAEHVILVHPNVYAGLKDTFDKNKIAVLNSGPIRFPIRNDPEAFQEFVRDFKGALKKIHRPK